MNNNSVLYLLKKKLFCHKDMYREFTGDVCAAMPPMCAVFFGYLSYLRVQHISRLIYLYVHTSCIRIWIECQLCYRSLCRDFYFQFLIIFFLFNPVGGREAQDPPTRIHLLSLLYRPTSAAMLLPLAAAGIRAICSNQVPICDISLWKIHSFASSSFFISLLRSFPAK